MAEYKVEITDKKLKVTEGYVYKEKVLEVDLENVHLVYWKEDLKESVKACLLEAGEFSILEATFPKKSQAKENTCLWYGSMVCQSHQKKLLQCAMNSQKDSFVGDTENVSLLKGNFDNNQNLF